MDCQAFDVPVNWVYSRPCIPSQVFKELRRRIPLGNHRQREKIINILVNQHVYDSPPRESWARELLYVRILAHEYDFEDDVLELLGRICCQVLEIPRDCTRQLKKHQQHNLIFFTNHRSLQIYCCHETSEKKKVDNLVKTDIIFRLHAEDDQSLGENYHNLTDPLFWKTRPLLAWESFFPEGIDMEALSPRDVNAHLRKQVATKPKTQATKPVGKEKDHPPPPPADVHEPPSSDRKDGAVYRTGKLLGKGGFAICYEGRLAGTRQLYALKIVKSHMPQKKMEQKFQTELQIHSKMHHPNIVRFHRAFSYNQCTFIVLEMCPNGSLMDMIKKRKFVTEPEVRFWTVQMAGAIKYMHAKGIIHRDLKMGNIFLDKDMNVKVGDFGLAALLMSGKDWSNCRRTTLCGTPNYIAPEILSKDKQGHDHAVDIWSLGIIIFAMLTGKPPFQSTTADEIYRRAREREYDWPKLNTSDNFISPETKDLVSDMLQAPEDRPDPDTIVQHPFFTCGWVPQSEEMTPDLREKAPAANQFLSTGLRTGRANLYLRNLKKLCLKCDVGPWNPPQKAHTSTYREVAAEEKRGLTPAVPLPEGVVYRPFDEVMKEQKAVIVIEDENDVDEATSSQENDREPLLRKHTNEKPSVPAVRPLAQSFAAQQRARPGTTRTGTVRQAVAEFSKSAATATARPMINTSGRPARTKAIEPPVPEKVEEVEDRLAADLANQLKDAEAARKALEAETITLTLNRPQSLFHPREKLETMSNTQPDDVLAGLRSFQKEIERALNSRSIALETKSRPPPPTIVVKWVDYTNRHGLSYILSNGSIGCIFKAEPVNPNNASKGYLPPACVLVRDSEKHLQNRKNEAYPDRYQLVPPNGHNVEFYENQGKAGILLGKVNPQNYKVAPDSNGELRRTSKVTDEWDDRKWRKLGLWKKFANYMVAFGRDSDFLYDEALQRKKNDTVAPGNVVTFYQRWGDVGCWGFCDGHFQFNFPDHTKIVLSADATWCDFYHLPMEAARDLANKGTMSPTALDDRQHLSFPLQTLLNFMAKPSKAAKSTTRKRPEIDPMIQGLPEANDFRNKISFIRDAVREWTARGGLGNSNMNPEGRLKWTGNREMLNVKAPYKHVWVTVGARGGDERRVAWFDPKDPEKVNPDVEG